MPQPTLEPVTERRRLQSLQAIVREFEAGVAQVFFLALSQLKRGRAELILSGDEAVRAERLVSPAVRHGFVGARWLVRSVLGAIVGAVPRSLELKAGSHGKPILIGHDRLAACFNLSHSGDLVALALVRARPIGIDIEVSRPLNDAALLARRILGPDEREHFERLPEAVRGTALLTTWTRKEAVLKAMGTGISGGLTSIDVLADSVACSGETPTTWFVRTLQMPPGFYGAIAHEGETMRFVTWQAVPFSADRRTEIDG